MVIKEEMKQPRSLTGGCCLGRAVGRLTFIPRTIILSREQRTAPEGGIMAGGG